MEPLRAETQILALFVIPKRRKQPNCPSMDGRINTMWHIYTMEYCLALKREVILLCATTGMNLEDTLLSELSQSQRDKYYKISFI